MVYDDYVKYEEAEIHKSAIMQDFRDSETKKIADWQPFWIFSLKFVMGYPCVLYSWSSHFAFLQLSKYYKIKNGR